MHVARMWVVEFALRYKHSFFRRMIKLHKVGQYRALRTPVYITVQTQWTFRYVQQCCKSIFSRNSSEYEFRENFMTRNESSFIALKFTVL